MLYPQRALPQSSNYRTRRSIRTPTSVTPSTLSRLSASQQLSKSSASSTLSASITARTDFTATTKTALKLFKYLQAHNQPNRKIMTCGSRFCSVELTNELLERGCALISIMKKSQRELTLQILEARNIMEQEFCTRKTRLQHILLHLYII